MHKYKKLSKEGAKESKQLKLQQKIKDFAKLVAPKKKSALKKRDQKAETKNTVKFNDNVEVHTFYERSWNDYKKKDFVKGAFS
jgi:hypothetical protein